MKIDKGSTHTVCGPFTDKERKTQKLLCLHWVLRRLSIKLSLAIGAGKSHRLGISSLAIENHANRFVTDRALVVDWLRSIAESAHSSHEGEDGKPCFNMV